MRATIIAILSLLLLLGCKSSQDSPVDFNDGKKSNLPPDPAIDLGLYATTEMGPGLIDITDFNKRIYGYLDKDSYNPGDSVSLFLSGPKDNSKVIKLTDVNDKVVLSFNAPIDLQQMPTNKPWEDGCLFKKTITIKLPDNLKSGLYYWTGDIPMICKNPTSNHEITVVYPSNTDNAYNQGGGKNIYGPGFLTGRAHVLSFLRFRYTNSISNYSSTFFKWLASQPYDVNYISDHNLDADYLNINNSKILIIAGHSEYWTRKARINLDKFAESGKNVLVLSGNTMYYQVRYNTKKDLMICYKDGSRDPLGSSIYSSVLWSDPIVNYPTSNSIGVEFVGYGLTLPNRWEGYKIVSSASPLLEGTGLNNGDILKIPTVEYDGAPVIKVIEPGSSEIPVIDNGKLNFFKVELLGYDFAVNYGKQGIGTFAVFKKTASSGTIVNTGSSNWCAPPTRLGGGRDADIPKIYIITKNMIDKSLKGETLFSK